MCYFDTHTPVAINMDNKRKFICKYLVTHRRKSTDIRRQQNKDISFIKTICINKAVNCYNECYLYKYSK